MIEQADPSERQHHIVQAGNPDASPVALHTWSRDPELASVYGRFVARFAGLRDGFAGAIALETPDSYMPYALRMPDGWGENDRIKEAIGSTPDGQHTLYAHHLHRDGVNGEYIATVIPNIMDRRQTIRTDSVDHAGQVLQILFDARNREMAELERLKTEAAANTFKPKKEDLGFRPKAVLEVYVHQTAEALLEELQQIGGRRGDIFANPETGIVEVRRPRVAASPSV